MVVDGAGAVGCADCQRGDWLAYFQATPLIRGASFPELARIAAGIEKPP